MKELLKNIILDQQQLTWGEQYIRRDFPDDYLTVKDVVVISGVRRCGKSTLLHQIRQDNAERDFYFNFDDERLVNFTAMSWSGTILPMNTKFLCSSTTLQETFPGSYPITA